MQLNILRLHDFFQAYPSQVSEKKLSSGSHKIVPTQMQPYRFPVGSFPLTLNSRVYSDTKWGGHWVAGCSAMKKRIQGAKSCITQRMVETSQMMESSPPISLGFRNHPMIWVEVLPQLHRELQDLKGFGGPLALTFLNSLNSSKLSRIL